MESSYKFNLSKNTGNFFGKAPYPYLIIDNFLSQDDFQQLSYSVLNLNQKPDFSFNNTIEGNKSIYSNESSPHEVQKLVNTVISKEFIAFLEKLTGAEGLITLEDLKHNQSAFRYFHEMKEGGILGSHVDHSMIMDKVHFLNSLFYLSPEWYKSWGGHTELFSSMGFVKETEIEYKPNRMVIFLHTSKSFHKVSKIKSNNVNRYSVYMDYYLNQENLNKFKIHAQALGFRAKFWKHQTTFVPTIEQLIKSFTSKKAEHKKKYLSIYLKYILKSLVQRL